MCYQPTEVATTITEQPDMICTPQGCVPRKTYEKRIQRTVVPATPAAPATKTIETQKTTTKAVSFNAFESEEPTVIEAEQPAAFVNPWTAFPVEHPETATLKRVNDWSAFGG